ncbi:hypothetical protein [Streptomyces olivaceiscleroticus]|uniref:Uncharacterized protein n=1 Tax=Streptomyces olivaceiscleroticus TaxID=68245 RepID=A0ABN1AEH2_9ACTN
MTPTNRAGPLWRTETWQPRALPSRARICKAPEAPEAPEAPGLPLEALEARYGPRYADRLYG